MKIIITENQLKKILLNENQYTKSNVTFNDIWFCNKVVKCDENQDRDDSPLYLVQQRLIEELNKDTKTKKWVTANDFTADKSFGPTTAKAIGVFVEGVEWNCPVNIGPKLLKKLGFEPPEELTEDEKILAVTLTMEMSSYDENEIKAISNVIANRSYIRNKSVVDIVKSCNKKNICQFSGWNDYKGEDVDTVICEERSYEDDSWETAVKYAKLLLSGANFSDNTDGATHYYNPAVIIPPWGGEDNPNWVSHDLGLIHEFGREIKTSWAKNPVIRK